MWRFFVAATLIVIAVGTLIFAQRGGPPDLRISGTASGTPTPTAERPDRSVPAAGRTTFLGSGSWTMSSLPSCFRERERVRGPLADLRAKFPPAAERVAPGSVVRAGDCTLTVGRHDVAIARGADRLRVPPEAALYRAATGLTLVVVARGHAEIRRY